MLCVLYLGIRLSGSVYKHFCLNTSYVWTFQILDARPNKSKSNDKLQSERRRSIMSDPRVLIGIIGGSGLYHLDNLTPV
ncbi:hypothetical protein FRC08_010737, partial [Ceratobasidium sp. 394]